MQSPDICRQIRLRAIRGFSDEVIARSLNLTEFDVRKTFNPSAKPRNIDHHNIERLSIALPYISIDLSSLQESVCNSIVLRFMANKWIMKISKKERAILNGVMLVVDKYERLNNGLATD